MDCKESLKEYIDKDEIYQDYKQDKLMNCSDFDKFCIQHCKDIEELLNENEKLKADYGTKVQVERDLLLEENQELKKQLRTSAIFNEEDIRLDQTKEVFETLANILSTESCSYRYLIYDLLGFKEENYIDLIAGMSITNAIVELEELENQQKEFIEYLTHELNTSYTNASRYYYFSLILSKYREIIGVSNENNT